MPIVITAGFCGNVLILGIMLRVTRHKNKNLAFVLFHVAVADLIVLVHPYVLHHLMTKASYIQYLKFEINDINIFTCKIFDIIPYFAMRWEILIFVVISVERFAKLCLDKRASLKLLVIIMCLLFLFCLSIDAPIYLARTLNKNHECSFHNHMLQNVRPWRVCDAFVNVVCITIMVAVNCAVLLKLLRNRNAQKRMVFTQTSSKASISSTTVLLLGNILIYILFSFPAKIYYVTFQSSTPQHVVKYSSAYYAYRALWRFLVILQAFNYCVNFYLNGAFSKKFRKDVAKFFRTKRNATFK